jgi:hypothetical protein
MGNTPHPHTWVSVHSVERGSACPLEALLSFGEEGNQSPSFIFIGGSFGVSVPCGCPCPQSSLRSTHIPHPHTWVSVHFPHPLFINWWMGSVHKVDRGWSALPPLYDAQHTCPLMWARMLISKGWGVRIIQRRLCRRCMTLAHVCGQGCPKGTLSPKERGGSKIKTMIG